MTSDGQPYHRAKYKEIVSEQVTLGYLTKGGVSYQDSEMMTPYERKIALDTMKEIYKSQQEQRDQAFQQMKLDQQNKTPKTISTKR